VFKDARRLIWFIAIVLGIMLVASHLYGQEVTDMYGRVIFDGKNKIHLQAPEGAEPLSKYSSTGSGITFEVEAIDLGGHATVVAPLRMGKIVFGTDNRYRTENNMSLVVIRKFSDNLEVYPYDDTWHRINAIREAKIDRGYSKDLVVAFGDSVRIYTNKFGKLIPGKAIYSGRTANTLGVVGNNGCLEKSIVVGHHNDNFFIVYNSSLQAKQHIDFEDAGFDAMEVIRLASGAEGFVHVRGQGMLDKINVFEQNSGQFTHAYQPNYDPSLRLPEDVCVGDFNKDGYKDFVVSYGGNVPSAGFLVYFQNQNGYDSPVQYACYHSPNSCVTADFDMDGDLDLAFVHSGYSSVSVFTNMGDGTFDPNYSLYRTPYHSHYYPDGMRVVYWNLDIYPDIALAAGANGAVILTNITEPGGWTTTRVEDSDLGLPNKYNLAQNYPNPFNPSTTIKFSLPEASDVKITVYNKMGQKVQTLADKGFSAGVHEVNFDGSGLTSGNYLYKIEANEYKETKKMNLIK
jgi:hypothetical protein